MLIQFHCCFLLATPRNGCYCNYQWMYSLHAVGGCQTSQLSRGSSFSEDSSPWFWFALQVLMEEQWVYWLLYSEKSLLEKVPLKLMALMDLIDCCDHKANSNNFRYLVLKKDFPHGDVDLCNTMFCSTSCSWFIMGTSFKTVG